MKRENPSASLRLFILYARLLTPEPAYFARFGASEIVGRQALARLGN